MNISEKILAKSSKKVKVEPGEIVEAEIDYFDFWIVGRLL